jgi:hypothetical protein
MPRVELLYLGIRPHSGVYYALLLQDCKALLNRVLFVRLLYLYGRHSPEKYLEY